MSVSFSEFSSVRSNAEPESPTSLKGGTYPDFLTGRPEYETCFGDKILQPVSPADEMAQAQARSLQGRVQKPNLERKASFSDESVVPEEPSISLPPQPDLGGYQPTLAHSPKNQTPRFTFNATQAQTPQPDLSNYEPTLAHSPKNQTFRFTPDAPGKHPPAEKKK